MWIKSHQYYSITILLAQNPAGNPEYILKLSALGTLGFILGAFKSVNS